MKRLASTLLLACACLFTATDGIAQETTATVSGQVFDPTGAGIAGARVTARNIQTGLERSVTTGDSANYTLPLLPIGTYDFSAEKEGFKKLVQTGIVLQVADRSRVDFKLQIGATSESLEVTAEVPLTQTDSSSLGVVIDNTKVVELPLNGRQFYNLALLVPGVTPSAQGSVLSFRGGFNVAGASELNNNFTLNGLDNNNQLLSAPAFRPSVDAIQEFKILTGVFPAEYGRNSGSQVIVTTKSGTNGYHGTAFEFVRNQIFDAANFFTPSNSPKPAFRQNQFGGTLGGKIVKNKTFFFASYEGTRQTQQITALTNVPTAAMLTGDFNGSGKTVNDPTTGKPFANNAIPAGRFSAPGAFLASLYPAPTSATPFGSQPTNNYTFSQPQADSLNLGSLRVDHQISEKDTVTASYNDFQDNTLTQNNTVCGSRVIPGFDCTVILLARLAGLTETHIFSPTLINQFRFAYSQFENPRATNDAAINFLEKFNIAGTRFDGPARTGVPNVSVTGFAGIGEPTNFPQVRTDNTFQFANDVTWNHGQHSVKFGASWSRFQSNWTIVGNGRGSYTFGAQASAPTTGYAIADLLLGIPTSTARSPYSPRIYDRTGLFGGYVQDDWKITPRLTLNVGFRYEYSSPTFEKFNTLSNFNVATGNIDIAGTAGVPQGLWNPNKKDFEPRFGFAYTPFANSRTVLRGGYGIFYNQPALNAVNSGPQQNNAPFVSAQTFNSSLALPITLSNPYPAAAAGAGSLTLSGFNRYQPDAQIQQWSLNVQRELTKSMVLEVNYQGSKGTRLPLYYNINQPLPGPGTVAQKQAARPYPQYGNINFLDAVGNSSYNGLLTKLQQKYSNGLSFLMSFTLGKSIDNTPGTPYNVVPSRSSAMNTHDLTMERGLSGFDIRSRFVFSPVYELPFGKGKQFLGGNKYADWLAGGWELSGILSFQTGRPFTILVSQDNANVLGNVDRPNIIGDANSGPKTVRQWINVNAFALAPTGTFGNGGRNNVIGPGLKNLDISLSRQFKFRDKIAVQFRAESFNLANHPNFDQPSQTFGVAGFGSITAAEAPRQIQFGVKIKY